MKPDIRTTAKGEFSTNILTASAEFDVDNMFSEEDKLFAGRSKTSSRICCGPNLVYLTVKTLGTMV
jgi:hypothetical protein